MHSLLLLWMCIILAHSALRLSANNPNSSPAVSITDLQGEFLLSWAASAADWQLERAPAVDSTSWQPLPRHTYESNALSWFVRVPAGAGGFYRLRKILTKAEGWAPGRAGSGIRLASAQNCQFAIFNCPGVA